MKDMQDCEFTVQDRQLFMLQNRNGKRTGQAALKVALDMVDEGLVTKQQAITMVEPRHLEQLLHPEFENPASMAKALVGSGLPASPGAAVGRIVFTAEDAEQWQEQGEKVILVRLETSPEDVGGMHAAEGILTARGGMTSHAAVVARGWGKPCVCGCEVLEVLEEKKCAKLGDVVLCEGDWLSLNGTTGEVFKGKQPLKRPGLSGSACSFLCVHAEITTSSRRSGYVYEVGGRGTPTQGAGQRRHAGGRQGARPVVLACITSLPRRWRSKTAPRAWACAARSTCFSAAPSASPPCAA